MTNWKRKLAAYLHDPPSKCVARGEHLGLKADSHQMRSINQGGGTTP